MAYPPSPDTCQLNSNSQLGHNIKPCPNLPTLLLPAVDWFPYENRLLESTQSSLRLITLLTGLNSRNAAADRAKPLTNHGPLKLTYMSILRLKFTGSTFRKKWYFVQNIDAFQTMYFPKKIVLRSKYWRVSNNVTFLSQSLHNPRTCISPTKKFSRILNKSPHLISLCICLFDGIVDSAKKMSVCHSSATPTTVNENHYMSGDTGQSQNPRAPDK
jgi:hypothetical protein